MMDKTIKHSKKDIIIISILCLLFLGLGAVAMDYNLYIYAFLPVIVLAIMLLLMKFYYSVFLVALLTPFSLFFKGETLSMQIPTEPILILVMLFFLWECFFNRNYDKKALYNPISLLIFVQLGWMLIAALFSWDIIVSIKYLISRLWFVIPCYFMMVPIFRKSETFRWFTALYGLSLSIIIIRCTIKFAMLGFHFDEMNQIPSPFYNDHTAYGAAIGLFLPITTYYLFGDKEVCPNKKYRLLFAFLFCCLLVGLILSYARATWLSVLAAVGVFVLIKLNIKLKVIISTAVVVFAILFIFWTPIVQLLEMNSQDSSGDLAKHVTSISNISTDASNTERINRWSCALRMAKERPLTGWGPGTYQFLYGSYQLYYQRTPISTNEGTLGNAHSEYIGPLSEQGVIGCLIVVALFGTTLYIGIKNYRNLKDKNLSNLSLAATLSLITYYTHGLMNNFLDTDKLSVPVWATIALVTSLYIYAERKEDIKEKKRKL